MGVVAVGIGEGVEVGIGVGIDVGDGVGDDAPGTLTVQPAMESDATRTSTMIATRRANLSVIRSQSQEQIKHMTQRLDSLIVVVLASQMPTNPRNGCIRPSVVKIGDLTCLSYCTLDAV